MLPLYVYSYFLDFRNTDNYLPVLRWFSTSRAPQVRRSFSKFGLSDTIGNVKAKIHEKEDIPLNQRHFMFRHRSIVDLQKGERCVSLIDTLVITTDPATGMQTLITP
jgi:hypothetical protein